jgi:hypothetical protein
LTESLWFLNLYGIRLLCQIALALKLSKLFVLNGNEVPVIPLLLGIALDQVIEIASDPDKTDIQSILDEVLTPFQVFISNI